MALFEAVFGLFGFGAMIAFGASVWLGWYRRWATSPNWGRRSACLAAPWMALAFATLLLVSLLRALLAQVGLALPEATVEWLLLPAGASALFGFVVGLASWPAWALPPWYQRVTGACLPGPGADATPDRTRNKSPRPAGSKTRQRRKA